MNRKSICAVALVYFVLLWGVFTWPLGKFLFTGIPSSASNYEKDNVIRMVPGDHLQLLYNFWLAKDMISGGTPLFHNLYEFNTGVDEERFVPRPYYAPASLFYAVFSHIAGDAFGWNISGLICILIGFFACWRLAARFVDDTPTALGVAAVAQVMPYTWVSLLGGSPAGFGVVWVPVLFLGLDLAIRDRRAGGGAMAGMALLFASWTDSHVFFFATLATPCWCLLSFIIRDSIDLRQGRVWREVLLALLPAVVLAVVAMVLFQLEHSYMLSGTTMESGRSDAEVRLFSPGWQALYEFSHARGGAQMYVGMLCGAILAVGAVVLLIRPPAWSCPAWRSRLFIVAILLGLVGVALLAMGLSGPYGGKAYVIARAVLSPFEKIRQPPKIFCLVPALLSVLLPLCVAAITGLLRPLRLHRAGLVVAVIAIMVTFKIPVSATICLLDNGNEAYRAVARDADSRGDVPRALAIPLWPGDSAWSSLNEHYAALYRLRMVNGYSPFVQGNYVEDIFYGFDSLNKGAISNEQLARLRKMGVGYILLHENAFPEKVSPFPVAFTLRSLLNNPHLDALEQSGEIWAFRVLDRPRSVKPVVTQWATFGPSRLWDLSHNAHGGIEIIEDPSTWRGRGVRMNADKGWIQTLHAPRAVAGPQLRWMLRARGDGQLATSMQLRKPLAGDPQIVGVQTTRVASAQWAWHDIPILQDPDNHEVSLRLAHVSGAMDLDMLTLVAGDWNAPGPGESVSIPAACFFHAGYSDLKNGCVVLRPDREPDRTVFYGPRMPIQAGAHSVELLVSTAAPSMTVLGRLEVFVGLAQVAAAEIVAGRPAKVVFDAGQNLPLELRFVYSRNAQVCVHRAIVTHQGAAPGSP